MLNLFGKLRDVGSTAQEDFFQVNDWLYRGGDPTKSLIPQMKTANIKTVISLRHRESIQKAEREFLDPLGMDLIQVPMTYQTLSEEEIHAAMEAIASGEKNIYVHCDHGKDRTGVVIAAHRVINEGWAWEDARREMIVMGFHPYRYHLMEMHLKNYLKKRGYL